jgi:16S rRNA (guanine966-N2)-methyltransferase
MPARTPFSSTSSPAPHAQEIRIIGGQYKRSKLPVPDRPGLRPTPNRVRETLFNWLASISGGDLAGWHCVDAFAGTGALGFEAASRGASSVLMVESDTALVAHLTATKSRLQAHGVAVQRGDASTALRALRPASVNLVFLDPPFDGNLFDAALQVAARTVLPGGWVYLEAPKRWPDDALAALDLSVYRHLKAGVVHAQLLQRGATPVP